MSRVQAWVPGGATAICVREDEHVEYAGMSERG